MELGSIVGKARADGAPSTGGGPTMPPGLEKGVGACMVKGLGAATAGGGGGESFMGANLAAEEEEAIGGAGLLLRGGSVDLRGGMAMLMAGVFRGKEEEQGGDGRASERAGLNWRWGNAQRGGELFTDTLSSLDQLKKGRAGGIK